jgi:hypothetical protein
VTAQKSIPAIALVLVVLSLLFASRPATAACEVCRSDGDNYKLCHQVGDAPGWRNGRTDCVDNHSACFLPGECCYLSQKSEYACSVSYPEGCPNPKECGLKDVQEKDI